MGFSKLRQASTVGFALLLAGCTLPFGTSSTSNSSPSPSKLSEPDLIAKAFKASVLLSGKSQNQTFAGTGWVVDASKGFIVTNSHVVSGLSGLKIKFNDGSESPGQVVAKNPCDDLAVVKAVNKPDNLTQLNVGDAKTLRPGDHVTSIGFPNSIQSGAPNEKPTSTEGSVNAVDLSAAPADDLPKFTSLIQHQAQIAPGNSGGPLLNDFGDVVGVNAIGNTALQTNYAISSKVVKNDLSDLESGKSTDDVGWRLLPVDSTVSNQIQYLGGTVSTDPSQVGMYIDGVDSGLPADNGKVIAGDMLINIEGTHVTTIAQMCDIVLAKGAGQTISVDVYDTYSSLASIPIETKKVKLP